ncbi:iron-containing alcohol dehydrogenase [Imbroritus primus]|uniref:Iron-containing alcohol dehydrogenase n=1 Tax=Imbroritus primus TaxID=3058603 RepID=A0ACD3SSE3_9BURK|nr:iron-containing alcohol dehydrogenase [Burkholderiaceae bacterium PBA]
MRMDDLVHFCAPARLIIAGGARSQLPALMQRLGYRHGVLVTDTFFTRHTPWVREYVDAAAQLGIATTVYDGGLPDPTTTLCDAATAEVRTQLRGTVPDHVIALGGGSNIDLAKALCLTLPTGAPVKSFVGVLPDGSRPLPLIAVPTTAGTGSEATPGAILLDPENATKIAVMDNSLRPQVALVDPELTYTCPPRVTADAGIDALTHALESFVTLDSSAFDREGSVDPGYSGRSAVTMLFAREAIRLCAAYLERAYRDGSDHEARHGMAYASIYAALSYGSAGLNAVHGIAYAVAGITHKSHGSTNAVMLPYVVDALRATRTAELAEVAQLFGIDGPPAQAAARLPAMLRDLVARLDIPADLNAFGITEAQLDGMTCDALAVARLRKAFPVADGAAAYARIVRRAWEGRIGD